MSQVKTSKLSRRMLGWFLIGNIAILPVAALVSLMTFAIIAKIMIGSSSRPSGFGDLIMTLIMVFGVPIILFIASFVGFAALKSHFIQNDFMNKLHSAFSGNPDYVDFDSKTDSGIAIKNGTIIVLRKKVLAEFPLNLVRNVDGVIGDPGGWAYVGVGQAVTEHFRYSAAKAEAEDRSGLILHLDDVNTPRVQFQTTNQALLERWSVILAQAMANASEHLARSA